MKSPHLSHRRLVLLTAALVLTACERGPVDPPATADEELHVVLATGSATTSVDDLAGLGEPINIDFGPDSEVNAVLVVLREGLLRPAVARRSVLDITITSRDGIDHFHGTDLIPLTEVEPFSVENRLVNAVVTWTVDDEPQVIGDVYTVCSTLRIRLLWRTWTGPERCQTFGPF